MVHRLLTLLEIRCPLHWGVPIHLVGVDPIERGRVGGTLEEKRHQQVPEPHLDRIGHDLALNKAARIPDHALHALSTKVLIRRKCLLLVWEVSQALRQDDGILQRQRRALSSARGDGVDRIADQHHRILVPDWLGGNIVDGLADDVALRCQDHIPDEGLILSE